MDSLRTRGAGRHGRSYFGPCLGPCLGRCFGPRFGSLAGAAPLVVSLLAGCSEPAARSAFQPLSELPERLSETGLYLPGQSTRVDPKNLAYVPQYPLWSDGASKRRWLRLPEGTRIDAADADHWRFPAGTRLWKEFSFGTRTETRYLEVTAGGPRYATYIWNAEGTDALLAPEQGVRGVSVGSDGSRHDIPSRADCGACHEGRSNGVLGVSALQLSPTRDPEAVHREQLPGESIDLEQLVQRDLVSGLPESLLETPPRIRASSPDARAALGYLYGNCAHCHNADGPLAELGLDFDQQASESDGEARVRASSFDRASHYRLPNAESSLRVAPGEPEQSSVAYRMRTASPAARMPPLGTRRIDTEGVALIERWILGDPSSLPPSLKGETQP